MMTEYSKAELEIEELDEEERYVVTNGEVPSGGGGQSSPDPFGCLEPHACDGDEEICQSY